VRDKAIPPSKNQKPKQLQQSKKVKNKKKPNSIKNQTKQKPREQSPTVAFVLPSATNLGMGFPIRLYRVLLRTLIAFPLLLAVFPTEMFLYPREIA
jgi:hypothetical protein